MKIMSLAIMISFCTIGCAVEDSSNEDSPESGVVTQASTSDSFTVKTTDGCGSVEFVDNGTLNGSTNDDFFLIHDLCSDGHGVRAVISVLDRGDFVNFVTSPIFNGNGLAGNPVSFDPGDITAGQVMIVRVCLVDGSGDTTPFNCAVGEHTSVDG